MSLVRLYAGALAALALVSLAAEQTGHTPAFFTREPVTALKAEACTGLVCSYAGALSSVTILVWWTGTVLAVLGATQATGRRRGMLIGLAAFTTLLAADDLFLFHESLFGAIGDKGEYVAMLTYGAVGVAIVAAYWRELLRTPLALAVAAGGWIFISTLCDFFWHGHHLVEDGTKLLGALTWVVYVSAASKPHVSREPAPASA